MIHGISQQTEGKDENGKANWKMKIARFVRKKIGNRRLGFVRDKACYLIKRVYKGMDRNIQIMDQVRRNFSQGEIQNAIQTIC